MRARHRISRLTTYALRAVVVVATLLGVVVSTLIGGASPTFASGGGSGGSATGVPPIQLLADSASVTAGASDFVQVVVSPAAPAGGETLTITASNAAAAVPSTLVVGAGLFNAQFPVTGNPVTAPTAVTISVASSTSSSTLSLVVNPAATPVLAAISIHPGVVVGGDSVAVTVSLTATAPPGGVIVGLTSDSTALTLPSSIVVPAGAAQAQSIVSAGAVTATTPVVIGATLNGQTVSGRLEIDTARTVTSVSVSPRTTDNSTVTTGAVGISVPADGNSYTVSLSSSNPAIATVPANAGFLDGQSTTTFPISAARVDTPTDVTITASAGGATMSATLTVAPVPLPPFDLEQVSVSPGVVAGAGTATGTVTMTTAAPAGGVTINLSSSDTKLATVPTAVFITGGATSAAFPVTVANQSGASTVGIGATWSNHGRAAMLGVTSSKGGTLLAAGAGSQVLAARPVNDSSTSVLGFYQGGTGALESGQMPPGISLISPFRPGEFVFSGSPQKAGTYTFVLKFTNVTTPYTLAYIWVITP